MRTLVINQYGSLLFMKQKIIYVIHRDADLAGAYTEIGNIYYKDNMVHRQVGPASISKNGAQLYYGHGYHVLK